VVAILLCWLAHVDAPQMPATSKTHEMCMPECKLIVAKVLYTHALPSFTKTKSQLAVAVMMRVHNAFVLLSVCADVCPCHCLSLQLQGM
jgi:hypothetical protein